jgi:cyclase
MSRRALIVAKIRPGAEQQVAGLFAASDRTDLPGLAGVRHRSLYVLDDVYVHLAEFDGDAGESVDAVRNHPLFADVSWQLQSYISPYNPETWRSPRDAFARNFYSWDAAAH